MDIIVYLIKQRIILFCFLLLIIFSYTDIISRINTLKRRNIMKDKIIGVTTLYIALITPERTINAYLEIELTDLLETEELQQIYDNAKKQIVSVGLASVITGVEAASKEDIDADPDAFVISACLVDGERTIRIVKRPAAKENKVKALLTKKIW